MTEQEQSKEPQAEDVETPETEVEQNEEQTEESAPAEDSAYEELNKRYLRLLADFDNFKRRTAGEKEDIAKYGTMTLVKELLPVLDSFELALKNPPVDSEENLAAYQEGFAKVQKQFIDCLGKAGLERIEAIGQEYDPNFHEAIMVVDDESQPANTVFDELRAGYKFKDKVIRPTVCRVTGNK
ncbi:MAG: nucleotide exchange factor GrpE [Peptococcaceae bacterium]|nr:nucleotide exchange factor GrpE [Peptococcaceae bacterium]